MAAGATHVVIVLVTEGEGEVARLKGACAATRAAAATAARGWWRRWSAGRWGTRPPPLAPAVATAARVAWRAAVGAAHAGPWRRHPPLLGRHDRRPGGPPPPPPPPPDMRGRRAPPPHPPPWTPTGAGCRPGVGIAAAACTAAGCPWWYLVLARRSAGGAHRADAATAGGGGGHAALSRATAAAVRREVTPAGVIGEAALGGRPAGTCGTRRQRNGRRMQRAAATQPPWPTCVWRWQSRWAGTRPCWRRTTAWGWGGGGSTEGRRRPEERRRWSRPRNWGVRLPPRPLRRWPS